MTTVQILGKYIGLMNYNSVTAKYKYILNKRI